MPVQYSMQCTITTTTRSLPINSTMVSSNQPIHNVVLQALDKTWLHLAALRINTTVNTGSFSYLNFESCVMIPFPDVLLCSHALLCCFVERFGQQTVVTTRFSAVFRGKRWCEEAILSV